MVPNKQSQQRWLIRASTLMMLLCTATACSAREIDKVDQSRTLFEKGIAQQSRGHQKQAIAYFEKAEKEDPNNWKASLSLAKSLMLQDRHIESLAILNRMRDQSCIGLSGASDFEREYQLGQAFLFYNKPSITVETASKAMELARTSKEKSSSVQQLFLSLIRDNQEKRASDLQNRVLAEANPTDEQVYIRAASIAAVLDPQSAKELLDAALRNLNKSENSGTFFRIAQIFDTKAKFVHYDRTKYSAWLNNSEIAYKHAFKLNPNPPIYQLALANNASKRDDEHALLEALTDAHQLDVQDQLPGYLLSKIKPLQVATANLTAPIPQATVKLTQTQLAIEGLRCSCKRSMIINSFKQIRGIILTTIYPKFPYVATVLIDESMIPIADVLSKIENKPLPEFSYKLVSSKPIQGAEEALQLDLDGRNLTYPAFADTWPDLKPN